MHIKNKIKSCWGGKVGGGGGSRGRGEKKNNKNRKDSFLFFNEPEEREGIMKQNTSRY